MYFFHNTWLILLQLHYTWYDSYLLIQNDTIFKGLMHHGNKELYIYIYL